MTVTVLCSASNALYAPQYNVTSVLTEVAGTTIGDLANCINSVIAGTGNIIAFGITGTVNYNWSHASYNAQYHYH